jgi:hypothetical protein
MQTFEVDNHMQIICIIFKTNNCAPHVNTLKKLYLAPHSTLYFDQFLRKITFTKIKSQFLSCQHT